MGPKLIRLPRILDHRGNLSYLQEVDQVPFEIQRVYWIYDVPGDEENEGHAFRTTEELVIALSGSFDVVLHDGVTEQVVSLNRPYDGLYVPTLHWRILRNFSANSVALIIESKPYDQTDTIRDFGEFRRVRTVACPG
jgi:hypothetical protein